MDGNSSNRRIKYALHLSNWTFENADVTKLKRDAIKVVPTEYQHEMDGSIFCPVCYTNLNRVPKNKEYFSNGRDAYFAHLSKYKDIKCDLRSTKPEGKRYESFEEARRAIDDEKLVIVHGFIKERPEVVDDNSGEYDETPVEDVAGPVSDIPLGKHNGESYKLPSKITTVAGICRNFDENLYKYYFLPGQKYAIRLVDLLCSVESVSAEDDKPRLYYGHIVSTTHLGEFKRPENIRMTYLKSNQINVQDFCLKLKHKDQKAHGIQDSSVGRTLILYGAVSGNGIGLCFEKLGWGEFALLPQKYASFLP